MDIRIPSIDEVGVFVFCNYFGGWGLQEPIELKALLCEIGADIWRVIDIIKNVANLEKLFDGSQCNIDI